jgi:DNA repair photolyase
MDTTGFTFAEQAGAGRQMLAIGVSARDSVRQIERLIQWPRQPGADWQKGFLAGMFDAHGDYGGGVLRIGGTDPDMIAWTLSCLTSLGFDTATDRPGQPEETTRVRLRGGLKEALRFFHTTDPAITSKRSIEGAVINGGAGLRVAEVESLGVELPMYDITTGTGDFIANGVVSHNCFARNTHKYLDFDAGHDFDSKIVVKVNAPEVVRKELAAPRWSGEHIAMGTNVDCYQRAEGRYRLMPGILSALRDAANPFSILTKGTLVLRDKELLAEASEVTDVGLAVSVGCVDEDLWRTLEPGTPSPLRRLAVCAEFARSGLPCAVLMGPVVPFLSDSREQLARTVRLAAEAGARSVTPIVLHLRPGAREWFLAWLGEHHPELVGRYTELYGRGAYAPQAYQRRIAEQVASLAVRYRVGHDTPKRWRGPLQRAAKSAPGGEGEDQLSLF